MPDFFKNGFLTFIACVVLNMFLYGQAWANGQVKSVPNPIVDDGKVKTSFKQTAVFAGGCFWSMQLVFQHVQGVISATSGYAGGYASSAHYDQVSKGNTGHAESVKVVYDPSIVTYGELLQVYFSVAHDPMQKNQQGPDFGKQYRSEIFAVNYKQKKIAESYLDQLSNAKIYPKNLMTNVSYLPAFYPAEDYHQNYATRNPAPYMTKKIDHLKELLPALYAR